MRGIMRASAASAPLRRRGLSIVLVVLVLVLLIAFVSFAVDVGRIRLARAQLQTAADSSARCGARALPTSSAYVVDQANEAAAENEVIDTQTSNAAHLGERINPGVELDDDEDIHFGTWNPAARTFTEIFDQARTDTDERRAANAVRTNARRLEARNNPVPLIFAPVVGVMHSSIEREATAYITGGSKNFGFIGLDRVDSNGNGATITNDFGAQFGGGVASDGNISLGNGDVYGDARPGIGKTVNQNPNSQVTGWMAPLDYKLADYYPPVTKIPPGTVPLPAPVGKVYTLAGNNSKPAKNFFGKFDKNAKTINVTGYCRVYIDSDLSLEGWSITNPSKDPTRLEIYVIGNHAVDLGGNSQQYCHVYAPTSTVKVHGGGQFHGWIVGKTLSFIGTTALHYDGTNEIAGDYLIRLVE